MVIPATAFNPNDKAKIINLYMDQYGDANLKHFFEIVEKDLQLKVNDVTINK